MMFAVPGAPVSVKAVSLGPQSVVVSWLDPLNINGQLQHSTVYMKTMENGRQSTQSFKVYPNSGPPYQVAGSGATVGGRSCH